MKQLLGWLAGGVAAAGVVGVAILATQDGESPPPAPLAAMDEAAAPAATQTEATPVADASAEAESLPLPRVSDLRVEPDGMTVLAGGTAAGEELAILLDGEEVERVVAGDDGQFATVMFLQPAEKVRVLSLRADPDGMPRDSSETFLIAPTEKPAEEPVELAAVQEEVQAPADEVAVTGEAEGLEAVTEQDAIAAVVEAVAADEAVAATATEDIAALAVSGEETLPESEDAGGADTPATVEAQDAPADTPVLAAITPDVTPDAAPEVAAVQPADLAPAVAPVLVNDETGVRLAQPAIAAGATPEVLSSVALDMIRYDATGQVVLSGRAKGAAVRVYLNNRAAADAPIGGGNWEAVLGDVAPGVYTIRIDELDAAGEVSSRIETPFLREAPEAVAAAMADDTATGTGVAMKTVQPGHTLWAIARERYGEGIHYVEVFAANRDRIRNPDLIYPGQVFVLPESVGD